jgi:fatty-acyl-CoA synthase
MTEHLIERTPSAYGYPLLIKQLLHGALITAPRQEIVYQGKLRFTYTQFRERISKLANALKALGVARGASVAVMDWDSHRYLECYFAVPMMGAVLQIVNIRLSPEQILYTINHARADVLLVHKDFAPLVESIKHKLETVSQFILLYDGADGNAESAPGVLEYERMLSGAAADFEFPDFDEDTRATTFYTTGTTGLPKGVYFSHRQLVLHTIAGAAALASSPTGQRLHRGDVYMPITPMFHVHAWGLPYMATMLGVKQVYPGRYIPEQLMELIRLEGVTFSHCVSTILHMLLNTQAAKTTDLSRWKVIIGGGALPRGLAEAAVQRGIDVFTGYGMSETCPIVALAQIKPSLMDGDMNEQLRLRCKTGFAVPLVDLRIVDPDMSDVSHNGRATGEIVLRAPWLTQGYYRNPSASEDLWAGGYLHTQDMANIDGEGYVQITDRIKDVIKTGGEWISSLELESLISQHPAVSEAAVIGIKDEKWGERPLALIVLKPDSAASTSAEDIRAHLRTFSEKGVISKYAVPEAIRFIDAIDKTSVGKIDKKSLRTRFGMDT